jgi:hypothetical protein
LPEGVVTMSIVRVGLAETKKFAEGYDAIFTTKKAKRAKSKKRSAVKSRVGKKKKAARKK